MMQSHVGDGFQLVFNLINLRADNLITQASEQGYGIIARMPLQFGLLTGKFSSTTKFTEDDHRSFRLTPSIMRKSLEILEDKIWPIAQSEGMSKTQLALNFILT